MNELKVITAAALSALTGGIIMFFKNGKFTWGRLFLEIALSLFVGAVVGSFLIHFTQWPYYVTCALCAVLGTMNVHVITSLQGTVKLAVVLIQSQIKRKSRDDSK